MAVEPRRGCGNRKIGGLYLELQDCADGGITPVFVPDDDPDHKGTVYDKEEEEETETARP